ncbi:MAG: ABC transporter ATP-binding protein [Acidimicrobiales bacterium]|nr:ABC transporter ATP-binding protein [Acidimicrobiales bacterium]
MTDLAQPTYPRPDSTGWSEDPGAAKPDPILVVEQLRRSFGGLTAVDVDHLEIQRHAITALVGPNGAGKTTLFNLLTGFDRADEGQWTLDGTGLSGKSAYKIARSGMVRSFQLTKSLARLTVAENVALAATDQTGERFLGSLFAGPVWKRQEREQQDRIDELLTRFKLDHVRNDFAGTLSGGQRKLLDMARALMADPALVCLDEPMAGVNPALTQSLLGHIKGLRDDGLSVVFVEHDMDVVMEISDWVVVLAEGQVIAEGTPAAIGRNRRVIEAYLGFEPGAET